MSIHHINKKGDSYERKKQNKIHSNRRPVKGGSLAIVLQQCGIYTLTAGSIFKGILDIYGTTNSNGTIYWWVGGGLFIGGIILQLVRI